MTAANNNDLVEGHLQLERRGFVLDAKFSFPAKGITALFGPSGSGKSTLLRGLAGLENTQGVLKVGSQSWQCRRQTLPAHQRPVGYVFQEADLFQHLNVRDNLLFGYRRIAAEEKRLRPDDVIERLGLSALLQRSVTGLSGGERQRVAVGRAILAHPQLLLLDEPLSALDKDSKNEILPYLEHLQEILPVPMLYVSHSHDEVARLADYLLLMNSGRILEQGPLATLTNRLDSPLTTADDRFSLVHCQLVEHLPEYQLSRLRAGNTELLVPATNGRIGDQVRLRVQARDVSLCLTLPADTSILNIVPVYVREVGEPHKGQRLLLLGNNDLPLLARISDMSFQQLGLRTGQAVFAQIKSVALLDR